MEKVLIVEDDEDIRELIKLQLQLRNFNVVAVHNGKLAIESSQDNDFNLMLIDRMLPDTNGVELCKHFRSQKKTHQTPIIFVTALAESENIVEGLEAGADDYITKPFDMKVLHARVQALLRRTTGPESHDVFSMDGLEVDSKKHNVKIDGDKVELTHTEYEILLRLIQEPGVVQTRRKLIDQIIGDNIHVTNRTIDTHIAGLRKKLGDKSSLIETIRGVGYRFKEE